MTTSGAPRGNDNWTQSGKTPGMGRPGAVPGDAGAPGGGPRRARFPRWAMAIMGAVTLLALAILVFSIVLGVRAGQKQLDLHRQQEIAITLQKALDLRAEGLLEESMAEYRHVLNLDPSNTAAGQGLESLLAVAGGAPPPPVALGPTTTTPAAGGASANDQADSSALLRPQAVLSGDATPTGITHDTVLTQLPATSGTVAAPVTTPATPAATLPATTVTDLLARAQTASRAGRWQEAVSLLEPLAAQSTANPTIGNLLFEGYVNLAAEKDNEDQLEAALTYYDKALQIRPAVAQVQTERTLIANYLDVLTAWDVEWPQAVTLLTQMYATDPQYRDVQTRLSAALLAYGDSLAAAGDWCAAAAQFQSATAIGASSSTLLARLAQATATCENGGTPVASALDAVTGVATPAAPGDALAARPPSGPGPTIGRILYSARDSVDGRTRVFGQPAAGGAAAVVIEDGAQPALRADGLRYVYRNMRSDQGGLSAIDPATGIFFRITDYSEDNLPSWDPTSGRIVFASNREGDRRWRIYAVWAEANGEVTTLSYGEAPAWNPAVDLIVHRGCDETGNGCGLWLMDGAGANRRPLTNMPGDNRPTWSPDGATVVFMSDGRDGNMEIYRVDLPASGAAADVTRLTDSSAIDAAPVVSPDNQWVAFLSNRDGAWKIYAVPIDGGTAQVISTLKGEPGDWLNQGMSWVR